jgi:hypothetical protein
MNSMPITINRIVRAMPGGSQSKMIQGEDGHFYVAKFLGNPQGNRILINEWISWRTLRELGVSTPDLCILELPPFLQTHSDLAFRVGNQRIFPQGSLHLGSRCPVHPEKTAVLDFLSRALYPKVVNLNEFATMFVFDTWFAQTDFRQAIFARNGPAAGGGLRAWFIDHGMTFDGCEWRLVDLPSPGLRQSQIYSYIDLRSLVEEALCRVDAVKEETLLNAGQDVPASWFAAGDRECLAKLFFSLKRRKASLRYLIARKLGSLHL